MANRNLHITILDDVDAKKAKIDRDKANRNWPKIISFHALSMAFVVLVLGIFMIVHIVVQGASTPAPTPSPSPSPSPSIDQRISALEQQIGRRALSGGSGLLAALVTASITALGICVTFIYNRKQRAIQRTQIVQSLLQSLFSTGSAQSGDEEKTSSPVPAAQGKDMFTAQEAHRLDIALKAMLATDPKLVTKVAAILERSNVLDEIKEFASEGIIPQSMRVLAHRLWTQVRLARARIEERNQALARRTGRSTKQVSKTLDKNVAGAKMYTRMEQLATSLRIPVDRILKTLDDSVSQEKTSGDITP